MDSHRVGRFLNEDPRKSTSEATVQGSGFRGQSDGAALDLWATATPVLECRRPNPGVLKKAPTSGRGLDAKEACIIILKTQEIRRKKKYERVIKSASLEGD